MSKLFLSLFLSYDRPSLGGQVTGKTFRNVFCHPVWSLTYSSLFFFSPSLEKRILPSVSCRMIPPTFMSPRGLTSCTKHSANTCSSHPWRDSVTSNFFLIHPSVYKVWRQPWGTSNSASEVKKVSQKVIPGQQSFCWLFLLRRQCPQTIGGSTWLCLSQSEFLLPRAHPQWLVQGVGPCYTWSNGILSWTFDTSRGREAAWKVRHFPGGL